MNKPHSLEIGSDMSYSPVFHDLAILIMKKGHAVECLKKRVAFNVVYIINAFNLLFLSVCEQKLGSFFKLINGIRWLQIQPCGDNALISVALCRVMNEKKGFCFAQ